MQFLRQAILSLAVVGAALFLWVSYVPSSAAWLERVGLAELLGVEAAAEDGGNGRGGFRGGGPVGVVVSEVGEGRIDDRVEAIGDGKALRSVTLRSEVSGQVVEILPIDDGYVEEGEVVLRLDGEAERIALERAQLMLANARDDAERLSQLGGTGAVTEVRLREARLALRTAELAVRQAEYDLVQRTVAAPISGWLGVLDVEVGDRISSQDVIATITDRSEILIDFRVPERFVGLIAPGKVIEARPLGFPDLTLAGTVSAIDNVIDRNSRTLRVQGRFENAEDRLRAGMAFSVSMRFPGETLLAVDPLSVQWSSEGSYVWAVRDGKAVRVDVTIRQRNSDSVIVEADLAPGEMVVIEGVQNLRPGAEVSMASQGEATANSARLERARL